MNRGDRGEPIFKDDADRECFLETLGEACVKTEWQVHAYCLMANHFHLVVETPQANLVVGMKWFLGTFTSRYNRRHRLFGHLFSGRYKSLVVDGSGNGYLRTVCEYVHLNPGRAKLLTAEQPLSDYRWSSYREYVQTPAKRPSWLRVDRLLGELGIGRDDAAGRRRFAEAMEERRERKAEPIVGERIAPTALDRAGLEGTTKNRCHESEAGAAVAPGNGDDVGLDCRAPAHGLPPYAGELLEGGENLQ